MPRGYKDLVAEIARHGEINGEINNLSDSLKDIYLIVKNNPGIKIKKIADARGWTAYTAGKQLADLIRKGVIEYRGSKKTGGYYVRK